MAELVSGQEALKALNDEGGGENEFSKFNSGSKYIVKVLGTADLMQFFSYGIYKKVHSFVAEKPSKKSKKGYPVEDLTPWDKAWQYHMDMSEESRDKHSEEASKYKAKERFAMGFYDLDEGKEIVIDLSKNQAQAVYAVINKQAKKLDRMAFELEKTGKGTSTTVSLTPIFDMEEDLTEEQLKNFKNAPEKFDTSKFDGILYEANEKEQVELLQEAGFDVSLIDVEVPAKDDNSDKDDGGDADLPEGV